MSSEIPFPPIPGTPRSLLSLLGRPASISEETEPKVTDEPVPDEVAPEFHPETSPDFGPTTIDGSLPVAAVAYAVLRRQFAAMLAHEPGTRLGEDPEELHQMRVAVRRLRAALDLFQEVLPAASSRYRRAFRKIGRALGQVRDLDVALETLAAWRREAEGLEGAALDSVTESLMERRQKERALLLHDLDAQTYSRLGARFSTFVREGRSGRSRAARQLAVEIAPDWIRARRRKWRKAGDQITRRSPPEAYHALRIRGKRFRYAVEFFSEIYGEASRLQSRRLADLQDNLGAIQDAHVAVSGILELCARRKLESTPESLSGLERVVARWEETAFKAHRDFPRAFRRARGKPWKALGRALDAGRAAVAD